MNINPNSSVPIFAQIATMLEDYILDGTYQVDTAIISTTQLSKLLKINPATAIKGVNILTEQGIIYKRRGMGMYVTKEAKDIIMEKRRASLQTNTIKKLIQECKKLNINKEDVIKMIEEDWNDSVK
ncbi:GntR family transcriptional regulator [Vallitalea guaymasensis]|uniref:GntR family transcriptional regulator n=1 Tax=Vallitalea guaymasensis TaxID=1185412 RepID=A0A8J8MF94_9FIRM|nr:GntR family transcriptional regulator [Vallitalea guaymasensis]